MAPTRGQKKGTSGWANSGGRTSKITAICDRNGLSISIRVENGERHETQLVEDALSDCFTLQLPRILVGDKAYDGDRLDMQLDRYRVMMASPHRSTTKRKTQDGRHLHRYRHRGKRWPRYEMLSARTEAGLTGRITNP